MYSSKDEQADAISESAWIESSFNFFNFTSASDAYEKPWNPASLISPTPGAYHFPATCRTESLNAMECNYAEVARKMEEIQPFLAKWASK